MSSFLDIIDERQLWRRAGGQRAIARASLPLILATAAVLALLGCSASAPVTRGGMATPPIGTSTDERVPSAANSPLNQQRLQELWDKRTVAGSQPLDYPIGPGDVIEISVPSMDELKKRTVRVSGSGDIELPLIGTIAAGGLTEAQLTDKLKQAVGKYMYQPQVEVFVREYHSRQVAVVGSVRSPGLITLQGTGQTILDAITKAGGMTPDAADEVVILPEAADGPARLERIANSYIQQSDPSEKLEKPSAAPVAQNVAPLHHPDNAPASPTLAEVEANLSNGPAVVIPLRNTALIGSHNYLNLPVAPGDVIVVPGGGNVMVTGWVYRPGFFQVGSGLTVLGAVGSAGGAMYAADPTSATLIRSDATGNKVEIPVNLTRIAKGEDPDIPVRANDVIDVPYSDVRIGPYVVYNVLTRMMVPLPAY